MYNLLEGLRIVEAAAFIAGPSAGLHCAQMGADVIRIDQMGGAADFHRWPIAPNGKSLYWEGLNKGKRSIVIDFAKPEGAELAAAVASAPGPDAGLVLTNFSGPFAFANLQKRRSDIICLRIMGWPDGTPAVDYTVNAASGIPYMTGSTENQEPVNHVLPAWDLVAGAHAAFMLVAAERKRRMSGEGQEIELALSDLVASTLSHLGNVAEVLLAGADRPRSGNNIFGAFGRDFSTLDGRKIMVAAITKKQWKSLVAVLDLSAEISSLAASLGVDFSTDEGTRFVHRDRLNPLFAKAMARRNLADLAGQFDKAGVTWAPFQTMHEAVTGDSRLFRDNPIFNTLSHPSGLTYPASGSAATLKSSTRDSVQPAPRLGQHTDEVLSTVLGLASGQIARLHDTKIIAGAES